MSCNNSPNNHMLFNGNDINAFNDTILTEINKESFGKSANRLQISKSSFKKT